MAVGQQEWDWDKGLTVLPELKEVLPDDVYGRLFNMRMQVCSNLKEIRERVTPDNITDLGNLALVAVEERGPDNQEEVVAKIGELITAMQTQLYSPIQLRADATA